MTTLSYSSQSMVPSVPYVKAVDVYLIISFFFVFGSLLEYAILLNIKLRRKNCNTQNKEVKNAKVTATKFLKDHAHFSKDHAQFFKDYICFAF